MIPLPVNQFTIFLTDFFMRSFFCCCAPFMKATNSREGFGIRIVFVVSIYLLIISHIYYDILSATNFPLLKILF